MRRKRIEIGSGNASGDAGAGLILHTTPKVPHVANFGAEAGSPVLTNGKMPLAPIQSGGRTRSGHRAKSAASETGARGGMATMIALPPSQTSGAEAKRSLSTNEVMPLAPMPSDGQLRDEHHMTDAASETGAPGSMNTTESLPPSQTFGAEARGLLDATEPVPLAPIQSGGQLRPEYHGGHAASETGASSRMNPKVWVPPSQSFGAEAKL
jgi:hypothetical protein